MNSYDIQWRKDNPEAYRSIIMKHRYGITLKEYNKLLISQNNVCAICKNGETLKGRTNLSVDHCHNSSKVRGLLCDSCNKGLGFFEDSPELLNNALDYLKLE